jgi:hypothetical protein
MFKTIIGLAVAGFVAKRACPRAYEQAVQAATDIIDSAADLTTAVRGQVKAYTSEAAADATQRLQAVNPAAIEELRALLDGQQPQQPVRPASRRAVRRP